MATLRALSGNWNLSRSSFRSYFNCCLGASSDKKSSPRTRGSDDDEEYEVIEDGDSGNCSEKCDETPNAVEEDVDEISNSYLRKSSYGSTQSGISSHSVKSARSVKSVKSVRSAKSVRLEECGHSDDSVARSVAMEDDRKSVVSNTSRKSAVSQVSQRHQGQQESRVSQQGQGQQINQAKDVAEDSHRASPGAGTDSREDITVVVSSNDDTHRDINDMQTVEADNEQDSDSDTDEEVFKRYQQLSASQHSLSSTKYGKQPQPQLHTSHQSINSSKSNQNKPDQVQSLNQHSGSQQSVNSARSGNPPAPSHTSSTSGRSQVSQEDIQNSNVVIAAADVEITSERDQVDSQASEPPVHSANGKVVTQSYADEAQMHSNDYQQEDIHAAPNSAGEQISILGDASLSIAGNDENLFDVSDLQEREVVLISKCGSMEVSFDYNTTKGTMLISVHQARDIPNKDRGGANNTQVRLLLLPTKKSKHKTKIKPGEHPEFQEKFELKVPAEDVGNMGIRFRLYGCERMRRERMIGECVVGFASVNLDMPTTQWLTLEPRSNLSQNDDKFDTGSLSKSDSASSTQSMQHGGMPELLCGIAYNGTTGRLSVEVIKGSNFKNMAMNRAPDTYVRLTLMAPDGQELSKSKTSVRRGQPNPLYKETFMFQVALFQLPDVTLMVSVYNKRSMKRKDMIGWFSLGFSSSGEEEMAHWNDMRESKGEQVCRWHVLLEA